jgi:AcrR family transcriptional regulator
MAAAATTPRGTGRGALLAAAADELVARGGRAEVADVARRAGTSVGLIYRHFGSKAGLLAAVVETWFDRLDAEVLDAPMPGRDWGERERRRTELAVAFHLRDPLAAVILTRLEREPAVAEVEAARMRRHIDAAAENLRRGQRAGEIPAGIDPELAGAAVFGGLRQVLAEVLRRPRPPAAGAVVDELWPFIAAACRFQPEETP